MDEQEEIGEAIADFLDGLDHLCDSLGEGLGDDHNPTDCKICIESGPDG